MTGMQRLTEARLMQSLTTLQSFELSTMAAQNGLSLEEV